MINVFDDITFDNLTEKVYNAPGLRADEFVDNPNDLNYVQTVSLDNADEIGYECPGGSAELSRYDLTDVQINQALFGFTATHKNGRQITFDDGIMYPSTEHRIQNKSEMFEYRVKRLDEFLENENIKSRIYKGAGNDLFFNHNVDGEQNLFEWLFQQDPWPAMTNKQDNFDPTRGWLKIAGRTSPFYFPSYFYPFAQHILAKFYEVQFSGKTPSSTETAARAAAHFYHSFFVQSRSFDTGMGKYFQTRKSVGGQSLNFLGKLPGCLNYSSYQKLHGAILNGLRSNDVFIRLFTKVNSYTRTKFNKDISRFR